MHAIRKSRSFVERYDYFLLQNSMKEQNFITLCFQILASAKAKINKVDLTGLELPVDMDLQIYS